MLKAFLLPLLCLGLFLLVTPFAIGQQNGSMESWTPSGSPPPFDWKYPTGWTTNNATTEFISAGVTRSTDKHGGSYAAQIRTLNIFGTNTRSEMALGHCLLDYPNYRVLAYTGGEPLTMVPSGISFYYHLTTEVSTDYAVAEVLIKHPSGSLQPDTVFHTQLHLPTQATYTQMHIPISGGNINVATDSIVIFFASNDTNEIGQNLLFIDDVTIDFISATQPVDGIVQDQVFPNPVSKGDILHVQSDKKITDLYLMDALGKTVCTGFDYHESDFEARSQPLQLEPGVYYLMSGHQYFFSVIIVN